MERHSGCLQRGESRVLLPCIINLTEKAFRHRAIPKKINCKHFVHLLEFGLDGQTFLTSIHQCIPTTAAAVTVSNQKSLDAMRFFPPSRMYGTPCREVDSAYSVMVLARVSLI